MESNWQGTASSPSSTVPGMLEIMVTQVRAYEDEHGLVEPADPGSPLSGGNALSSILEHRIAAIKGILVAHGLGSRLVRLETYGDALPASPEALLRGVTLQPNPSAV